MGAKVEQLKEGEVPFVPPTKDEEQRVIRKLDFRLLPLVFVLYSLAVLDRSNLGNAKLAGLTESINLTGYRYNWLGTIFYIAYILSQWLLIGWKQFKPHNWCAAVVLFWGFVATIQATVHSWAGLMTCRFFLGIAEACFGPGVPLYLTYFYPRDLVGFRQGVFISGAAMANVYGGILAYGITQIKGSLAPWKILFLIEGIPTCFVALAAWFFLPDGITQAKFLTEREKEVALHFVARNQKLDVGKQQGIRVKELLAGIRDPKSFLPGLMYFGCNVSFASLPLFVPTIIEGLGHWTSAQSNGLSAPPYALCFFMIIILCTLSDRCKVRGPFVAVGGILGFIGFVMQATSKNIGVRYAGIFFSVNIFASVALLLAWVSNIHAAESRRAGGFTVLATLGQCGPLLGTNVFPATEAPYYHKGLWISAAMCLMVAVVACILSLWLIWENKKMDKEGIPRVMELEDSVEGVDENIKRRYVW
ncbi:MFS general substrate transporter [Teratosphaeria nubilosa]|uniref:MFS general substrate transporter n=1 Tax=Teratosphaeria nubilosa TaxID=161662 RepID=A0A6G1L9H1_9PEZI|nr:MFS general substrate transporter [Teratosphaeria nubilosa]